MEVTPQLARRSSFQEMQQQSSQSQQLTDRNHHHDTPNSSAWQENSEPIIKSTDMPDVMQQHAIECTLKAIEIAKSEGAKKSEFHNFLAKNIKKEFDATYGGVWHCVVGR